MSPTYMYMSCIIHSDVQLCIVVRRAHVSVAVCCIVVQCVALWCSVLQCVSL